MKLKHTLYLFIFFFPIFLIGQGVSILPSQLDASTFGSWEDEENELRLIIRDEYIVIQNELFYYYEIVKENETLNFVCRDNSNVKYIKVSIINTTSIYLDEGFKITKLTKVRSNDSKEIVNALLGRWHSVNQDIQLFENEIVFSNQSYKIDYLISTNKLKYHIVAYKEGDYYYLNNSIRDGGDFLSTNFLEPITFKKETFFQKYAFSLIAISVIILLIVGYLLFKWKITLAEKKEQTKRRFAEVELKSIRSQMNPHFLFNALSAIQNLINKGDNESANYYLTEFSQLMRLTLDKSEEGLVPLSDEIKSITKYLELEKLRFPFNSKIEIDSNINVHEIEIPAMLIQPFVENAIIHGLNEKQGDKNLSVTFKVKDEKLVCFIKDDGIGFEQSLAKKTSNIKREAYGVKLAKDRIDLINESYKTEATLEIIDISKINKSETGTWVKIYMPLKY